MFCFLTCKAKNQEDEGNDGEKDPEKMQTDGEFEHVKDSKDHWDAQTIDTGGLNSSVMSWQGGSFCMVQFKGT